MADRTATPQTNLVEYTVSELAFALKRTVEDAYGLVKLRGEISGFRGQHGSGHCYFTLKDEKACIEAVIWRSTYQRLKCKPDEGLEVIARGRVTTYPDRSKYQIVIDELEPAGIGALLAQLEERKKRLAAEGLFDPARKRPLPFLPRIVGVVTSPTGAVIRDILHRLEDRFPSHVLVWPVRVQGETCAVEVSAAIVGFNRLDRSGPIPRPDLLIVARGGGSLEDLWGFNDEGLARTVASSTIPLISAVGHETDWTIIDLVADFRAPTPTAAAERAVPVRADLLITLTQHGLRVATSLRRRIESGRHRFGGLARGLPRKANILDLPRQRFDHASSRLKRALIANARAHRNWLDRASAGLRPQALARAASSGRDRLIRIDRNASRSVGALLDRSRAKLDAQAKLLFTLGYHNVLARGFALVRGADGAMLRRASEVQPDAAFDLEFADGHVAAHADSGERKPEPAAKLRSKRGDEKQGSLL
ncbi:MAG TPA: exodeoxyribonuclease VII large subunit [Methyloceanibacter sp.]|jgi:exodeoxyribonuclease VII large subunit|nr:exodeoxyribonuclease VII large subunit [Methyloceanibacter sp.]